MAIYFRLKPIVAPHAEKVATPVGERLQRYWPWLKWSRKITISLYVFQSESPLMIKPYIKDMTKSELHAIMTGGFATVAGSVLGAYIKFNVSASHLLSASVMSAPAALAISKLFYPETEPSKTMTAEDVTLPKGKEVNVVEAAANGASTSIKLVANIAVNLIAFLAFLALINALLSWFGSLLGHPEVTFEVQRS
ncbi:PREDICTED: solute carrier family 28 member 3-like [Priapulus caudatus]|uniref:Solute carrier family 28 member 3-like n=1 Tax=Priapulus caudatus TaxID=37621 RepID=A0ABM1DV74_PRICU|nr:PREDICTED: solute carrier family 28 member 3-like [Priapulus caudatus]